MTPTRRCTIPRTRPNRGRGSHSSCTTWSPGRSCAISVSVSPYSSRMFTSPLPPVQPARRDPAERATEFRTPAADISQRHREYPLPDLARVSLPLSADIDFPRSPKSVSRRSRLFAVRLGARRIHGQIRFPDRTIFFHAFLVGRAPNTSKSHEPFGFDRFT